MLKRIAPMTAVLLVSFATAALAVGTGSSMFAIQHHSGTADLYSPSDPGYISAYDHSEIGAQGQFWHLFSDDYAFALAGGVGFFSEEDEPGTGAPPLSETNKYSQSSFYVRVGGDRVVNISPSAVLYFGPGIEYWSGKAKFEGFGGPDVETESVTRISLSGRMGGMMMLGSGFGLVGEMGSKLGRASAEEDDAKVSWWPSSWDAHGGIVFVFGGGETE